MQTISSDADVDVDDPSSCWCWYFNPLTFFTYCDYYFAATAFSPGLMHSATHFWMAVIDDFYVCSFVRLFTCVCKWVAWHAFRREWIMR